MSNIQRDSNGAPYPQHENKEGRFVKTGENNPLPSKDVDAKTELEAVKAEIQEVKSLLSSFLDQGGN